MYVPIWIFVVEYSYKVKTFVVKTGGVIEIPGVNIARFSYQYSYCRLLPSIIAVPIEVLPITGT